LFANKIGLIPIKIINNMIILKVPKLILVSPMDSLKIDAGRVIILLEPKMKKVITKETKSEHRVNTLSFFLYIIFFLSKVIIYKIIDINIVKNMIRPTFILISNH
jgi:hypothetical protein